MKYIAIFDENLLSNFRLDDGGLTLVMKDKRGATRAVRLKPIIKPTVVKEDGESAYITQGHIDSMLEYEAKERVNRIHNDYFKEIKKASCQKADCQNCTVHGYCDYEGRLNK